MLVDFISLFPCLLKTNGLCGPQGSSNHHSPTSVSSFLQLQVYNTLPNLMDISHFILDKIEAITIIPLQE